jgi:hypothetical protein
VPDTGRPPDLSTLTRGELQRTRRDLAAALALARPGAPARQPISTHLAAIDAELASRTGQHHHRHTVPSTQPDAPGPSPDAGGHMPGPPTSSSPGTGLGAFALSKDAQPPIPYRIAILSIPGRSIGAAKSVAFSPSGTTLAVGYGDGRTDLWNPATHKITATLPGPDGSSSTAESVAFSPNGTTLAVGNENGSTYLWNVPG